jgi:hypothetical protein
MSRPVSSTQKTASKPALKNPLRSSTMSLLATVAAKRELASADSVAEVIAWRVDAFLDGNPRPPQPVDISPESPLATSESTPVLAGPAYESSGEVRKRLTESRSARAHRLCA